MAEALELPSLGGRDTNTWVDCLMQSDHARGAPRYAVPRGTGLTLRLDGLSGFAARCPEQHAELIGLVAEVNRRASMTAGRPYWPSARAGSLQGGPAASRDLERLQRDHRFP